MDIYIKVIHFPCYCAKKKRPRKNIKHAYNKMKYTAGNNNTRAESCERGIYIRRARITAGITKIKVAS